MLSSRTVDAFITFRNSQGETVRGVLTNYQRRSLVMEIYNPYSIVQVSEVLSDLTVRSGDRAVYRGKAVVASLLNTGLMAMVSVTLTDEWDELATIGLQTGSYSVQAQAFVEEWDVRFKIGQDYQVAVSQLRTFLSDVSRWIDQADMTATLPKDAQGRLRDDVFFEIAAPLMRRVRSSIEQLEDVARTVSEQDQPSHRTYAQTAIHPLILRAPFVYRAFAKPLGYAGDYHMVNQMLGDPRDGASTYFQIINAFFLDAAVARAHRNRIDILVETLSALPAENSHSAHVRILNVGCGPAIEIQRLIEHHPHPERFAFTLMDFSEETLEYTRGKIAQACSRRGVQVSVELVHESVHNLLKRSTGERRLADRTFDFAYCAGLYDYLSDKVCNRLLQYFSGRTRPGGSLLVTNVHKSNPDRHVMEHLLEWHLIYRDETDMHGLAPEGTLVDKVWTDPTGVNVFMRLVNDRGGR